MENQVDSKSFMVNNGVTLGIASVLFALVMYATGNHLTPHWSAINNQCNPIYWHHCLRHQAI